MNAMLHRQLFFQCTTLVLTSTQGNINGTFQSCASYRYIHTPRGQVTDEILLLFTPSYKWQTHSNLTDPLLPLLSLAAPFQTPARTKYLGTKITLIEGDREPFKLKVISPLKGNIDLKETIHAKGISATRFAVLPKDLVLWKVGTNYHCILPLYLTPLWQLSGSERLEPNENFTVLAQIFQFLRGRDKARPFEETIGSLFAATPKRFSSKCPLIPVRRVRRSGV
jgi:hypothetical protein